ncbi:MAG: peptidoglycan DD-metalloendopeptidase family protein, partial [bacterium]
GRVMIVDHGNGFYTVYGHLEDSLVEKGADVQRGTRVGTVGDDGTAGRPSLYFEVRSRGKAVDPMKYLS